MVEQSVDFRPSPERPLLLGLLVDVSGSMTSSIENRGGKNVNRLESFRDALEDMVKRAGELSQAGTNEPVAPLLKLFAYGFGFGNLLTAIFGGSGPSVRDLLQLPGAQSSTIPLDRLTSEWRTYRAHVEGLARQMFGNTPMREGFTVAGDRFSKELRTSSYSGRPVLFVLSDGEPSDASSNDVAQVAAEMQKAGILVVSCYVTSEDIAEPRRLYGSPRSNWPEGAALMLECASPVPSDSPFSAYLAEYNWALEPNARLFTQINQSETLSEFMNLVLSPLQERSGEVAPQTLPRLKKPLRVFVSYSHADSSYVGSGGLLQYLAGLQREGIEFWHDDRLVAGDGWDAMIKAEIAKADIALVLVSQAFLNSAYCQDIEVQRFLDLRTAAGLIIFPVIVAPCDWQSHAWLASTQFEPRQGQTIETDYKDRGSRERLYLRILNQLRTVAERIRGKAGSHGS